MATVRYPPGYGECQHPGEGVRRMGGGGEGRETWVHTDGSVSFCSLSDIFR